MRRLLALLFLLPLAPAASAAPSYDACTGFIDTLPATVSTQGNWCLRKDLATAITDGAAITINANNVTIDCNGFKIGGLAAGPGTGATGISSYRLNSTVRNCAVRGFYWGMSFGNYEGGGHLVEDNRIDQSLYAGIFMMGDGNLIQRNRIADTGTELGGTGIIAQANIRDNTITGVLGTTPLGISAGGQGTEVRGNHISHLGSNDATGVQGIQTTGIQQSVVDNRVSSGKLVTVTGTAIHGGNAIYTFCRDNLVAGYTTGVASCDDVGGNVSHGAGP